MKKTLVHSCIFAIILFCIANIAYAGVTVKPASGGDSICSNVATDPKTLGPIKIIEGLMTDFNTGASSITLVPPAGWSFIVALPTITAVSGGDVSIGVVSISAGALSVNFNASGTTHFDTITIASLQIKAASVSSATGNITASSNFGVAGITTGASGTNFGTLSIITAVVPSVTITPSPDDTICTGGPVTFTPTPVNGGATPAYQWYLNGSYVGSGGTYSSGVLVTGSMVYCRMVASGCVLPAAALSNTVTMTAIAPPSTAVTVTGGGTFCTSAALTAANGGSGTIYFQGTTSGGISKVLGGTPQTVSSSGTYYFNANSGGGCWGTEGSAIVTITPVATANAGSALTVCAGDSVTLAGSTGGSATSSIWSAPSGTFSNTASVTSKYTPSIPSGSVTLTLTAVGPCGPVTSTVNVTVNDCHVGVNSITKPVVSIYPNPSTSTFRIDAPVAVNVTLIDQTGRVVLRQKQSNTVDVSNLAAGLYIMMVYDEDNVLLKTEKIAKTK